MSSHEQVPDLLTSDGDRRIVGSGLIQLVLGAVILWVGQTTFEHAGTLAGIQNQVSSLNEHYDKLTAQHNRALQQLAERTRSRFTREDAEKIVQRFEALAVAVNDLKIQVHGLKMYDETCCDVAGLVRELEQLRAQLAGDLSRAAVHYPTTGARAVDASLFPRVPIDPAHYR